MNIQFFLRVPSTKIALTSMLKAVMFGAALIRTFAISLLLGTDANANPRSMLLMMDPLLQK